MPTKFPLPAIFDSLYGHKSLGEIDAIWKQLRILDLKPVKNVSAQFDPFHANVKSIRDTLFFTSSRKIKNTNPKCGFKIKVLNDRTEPILNFTLESGKNIIFKTENLTALEILQELNKIIKPLAEQMHEEANKSIVQPKSLKMKK